ncbi:Domain X [Macleaya cordata]|uniref:Domain X n=1 Tax=Macleaya cordata TaxID=56857 RepID=A0A200QZ62_MACCD|nr:Domain X [Macleaya cordata]
MVLEIIYDKRFATFSYGGRVGMGRHTAVRYLKTTVQNPNWWFRVCFRPSVFDFRHVSKLSSIIEEKIEDKFLVELIKRFFEFEALRIELGGCFMGRGFPQESSLSSILVNIYFNGFDKEIQDFRLKIDKKNPRFDPEELMERVFHKPVKVYAVRYLDEILVITSGSKVLTLDLKNQVVKFLEGIMGLEVDKLKTTIHSAVSEKIDFLGMELQAVPPSVLHPRPSEKEIRARKKYTKQKEAKALELKNARETNRKKLGLKILNHVFKKLKRGDVFKFDFQIEREVRNIFRSWGDEVVQEFFGSLEERLDWYRKFSSGDFLSLRAIRNLLPHELVDAYDQFQEQVFKHLTPLQARKALEEVDRQVEEEDRQNYAESTVDDLTKLCMKVSAPPELVRKAVKLAGFTNSMGRPRPIKLLICLDDSDIIKWYAGVGRRWLDFFCCCRNFKLVKTVVTYHLRFSCILTLAEKHESTKLEAIRHYTKDLKVSDATGMEEVHFPTEREIKMMGDRNLSDPKPVDGALTMALIRLASNEPSLYCMAHFCDITETALYRIRLLQNRLNVNPLNTEKWVPGMGAIHESLNRKCLSLCYDHMSDLNLGTISLQDIDCTSFVDMQ